MPGIGSQLRAPDGEHHLEVAMTVREKEYKNSGASCKRTIIPLCGGWIIRAKAIKCSL